MPVFDIITSMWRWMPQPLGAIASGVACVFLLVVFYHLIRVIVEIIKAIWVPLKMLLISWGIPL